MLTTRPLEMADLDLVCRHRHAVFAEAGRDAGSLDAMAAPFRAWLAPRLADGRYFGFVTMEDEREIAGIGLMEIDWPPHPLHPGQDRRGYVLNVYVEPDCRRRGIARRLMRHADDAFRARGMQYAILHATADGRPLYETLGWQATTEMARAVPAAQ